MNISFIAILVFLFLIEFSALSRQNIDHQTMNNEIIVTTNSFLTMKSKLFSDPCLMGDLQIIDLNTIDSIVELRNVCKNTRLGVIAAEHKYPDGKLSIYSIIKNDTVSTISIGNYLGDDKENGYEVLLDSVIRIWHIQSNHVNEIYKDSVRTTIVEKYKL